MGVHGKTRTRLDKLWEQYNRPDWTGGEPKTHAQYLFCAFSIIADSLDSLRSERCTCSHGAGPADPEGTGEHAPSEGQPPVDNG